MAIRTLKSFLRADVVGLACVAACGGPAAGQTIGTPDLIIVAAPGNHVASQPSVLGRAFEPAGRCSARPPDQGGTAREVLGRDLRAILVHSYDEATFGGLAGLTVYIRRILVAHPEGGSHQSHPYWSEGYPVVMAGSLEYRDGRRSRIELGNGYLHFEDSRGCQWWGRYLGGDRKSWVVHH